MKWFTKSDFADLDTGEVLDKKQIGREYVVIKKTKKTILHANSTGTVIITNWCRRNPQIEIFPTSRENTSTRNTLYHCGE